MAQKGTTLLKRLNSPSLTAPVYSPRIRIIRSLT